MGFDNVAVLLTAAVLISNGCKAEGIKVNKPNDQSTTEKFNPLAGLILNDSSKYMNASENSDRNILNRVKRQFGPYGGRQYYPLPLVFGGLGGFGPGIGFPGRGFGGRGFGGRGFGGGGFRGPGFAGQGFGSRGFGGRGFGGRGFGGGFGGRGFGGGLGGGRGGRG